MKKDTLDLVIIVCGILLVIMMGAVMLLAVRWSRKKNAELRTKGDASQFAALNAFIKQSNLSGAVRAYFAATTSDPEINIGKILAVIGIAICLVFLVFACLALIKSI